MTHRLYVATRKGLFDIRRDLAGDWRIHHVHFLGDNLSMMLHDPRDGALYAALDHGHFGPKLHRSDDGGGVWEEIATPKLPEAPEGAEPDLDMWQRPMPTTVQRVWALEPADPAAPGTLWCGTIPGGLFRSDDRGAIWQLVETLWQHPSRKKWMGGGADWPGIHSICVDPRDASRVHLGVSCGGVWYTDDAGQTWRNRSQGMVYDFLPVEHQGDTDAQDPHLVVRAPSQPDTLWTQHHCGIFRTTNGGDHWDRIHNDQPSAFGFAVAVHPQDPDTAWFVPAVKDEKRYPEGGRVVVTRTRDGGQTFDVLRKGLPQHHAYDLVYRHALHLAADGQTLAFGSTTGSLWISENQGDVWQTISTHLPPVHCVRFAG